MKNLFILIMIVLGLTSCQKDIVEPEVTVTKLSKGQYYKAYVEVTYNGGDSKPYKWEGQAEFTSLKVVKVNPTDNVGYFLLENTTSCALPDALSKVFGRTVVTFSILRSDIMTCK